MLRKMGFSLTTSGFVTMPASTWSGPR